MKARFFPTFATFSILALAAVSPAQDRGRDHDKSSDRSSHSGSDHPSRSRADHGDTRSRDDSRRSRDDSRSTRPDRNDTRTGGSSDSRGQSSRDQGNRDPQSDRTGSPDRTGSRDRAGSPDRTDRQNPFDRSNREGRSGGDSGYRSDANRPRPVLGGPSRDFRRDPVAYDGRGRTEATRFGAPPVHSALGIQIHRTDVHRGGTDFAFGGEFGGLRVGYVSYGGGGYRGGGYGYGGGGYRGGGYRRDGFGLSINFGYPYYAYDPYAPDVVVVASPWYRYSYLPPYIDNSRVIVVHDAPERWALDGWRTYDYRNDRRNEGVQNALDDLTDAFEDSSSRYADRLVPEEGNVAIYNDGRYDYSLNPDDFQKMLLDGIEQSKTVRYEILDVRTQGDEVRIRARHTFTDSWDKEQSVIHTITLRRDGGGEYVIREFGSE